VLVSACKYVIIVFTLKYVRTSIKIFQRGYWLILLQAVAKHLRGTVMNSSAVISSLVGPVQQMSLANHPVKGLYFTLAGGPEVS